MGLFIFNPDKLLVGKLSKRMCKPFDINNDKIIIEKNLKNLLNLKLLYSDYVNDNGDILADTIAIDNKTNTLYLIGYKKNSRDNFLKRYEKQYLSLEETKDIFLERVRLLSRKNEIYMYNFRAIFIASSFTSQEINSSTTFPVSCDLYTWSYVKDMIIFRKKE